MTVRNMQDNPHIWEQLGWDDMSGTEQALWTALGWQANRWDNNDAPASADKEWSELTPTEQNAANGLGFTEQLWNATEDE
jgi:hypothetical protein